MVRQTVQHLATSVAITCGFLLLFLCVFIPDKLKKCLTAVGICWVEHWTSKPKVGGSISIVFKLFFSLPGVDMLNTLR